MPQSSISVNVKFDKSQMDHIEKAIKFPAALRRGLALSLLVNIILLVMVLVAIGGK